MFSLIIVEMPKRGRVRSAIKGPWIYPSEFSAYRSLFKYVIRNVAVAYMDEFLGSVDDTRLPEWAYTCDRDESGDLIGEGIADLEVRLDSLEIDEMKRVINWYFDLIEGSLQEAFYEIKAHVRPYRTGESF